MSISCLGRLGHAAVCYLCIAVLGLCLTVLRCAVLWCAVLCVQLWATIGHCFNPPPGATSLSSRMSQFYNTMLAPFDKVAGPPLLGQAGLGLTATLKPVLT